MSEGLSSHVTTLEAFPWQVVSGRWGSDATQTFQPATGLLHVPQVKGTPAIIASSCTFVRDPWAVDPRMEMATSPAVRSPRRPKLTAKEARELALSILKAAEASRLRFAEEEAAQGISWEERS